VTKVNAGFKELTHRKGWHCHVFSSYSG